MNVSWKTTLCGALGAVGAFLQGVTDPAWMPTVGKILAAVALAGVGLFARDHNVSSEQAGVNPPTPAKP